jgi:hypothetical protein
MALPAPPVLTATVPYTKFSTTKYLYVPTIAVQAAPTLAEINAGKDVTLQLTAVAGFDTTTASLDLPRGGTTFTGNLPGRKTANDSSMTFILSTAGPTVDVRSVILEAALAFVVICNEGIVTGGFMDVWPVRVGSVSTLQDLEAIAMAHAQFYVYQDASKAVAIPTA